MKTGTPFFWPKPFKRLGLSTYHCSTIGHCGVYAFVYLVWRTRLSFVSAQRCPVIINLGWTACGQQQVCSMNWAAELQSAQCVCELCCQTCVIMTVICINRKCGLCLPGHPHNSAESQKEIKTIFIIWIIYQSSCNVCSIVRWQKKTWILNSATHCVDNVVSSICASLTDISFIESMNSIIFGYS